MLYPAELYPHRGTMIHQGKWGGRRVLNPLPPESQSGALPVELRPPLRGIEQRPDFLAGTKTEGKSCPPGSHATRFNAAVRAARMVALAVYGCQGANPCLTQPRSAAVPSNGPLVE